MSIFMKKYNKKSYIRLFGTGILLLCTFSLVSVGFSAWYSGIGENQYAKVSLEVGSVTELSNYVVYDKEPVSMPTLCEDGVVDKDEEMIIQTCDIVLGFTLNITDLRSTLKTYYSTDINNFVVTTTLSHTYDCVALFKTYLTGVSMDMATTNSDSSTTETIDMNVSSTIISSQSYCAKFAITHPGEDATSLYLKIKYSFDFQHKFKADVYSQISHNALILTFKAGAEL